MSPRDRSACLQRVTVPTAQHVCYISLLPRVTVRLPSLRAFQSRSKGPKAQLLTLFPAGFIQRDNDRTQKKNMLIIQL